MAYQYLYGILRHTHTHDDDNNDDDNVEKNTRSHINFFILTAT